VIAILTVIAMGTLTYKGATAKEALGSEIERRAGVGEETGLRGERQAWPARSCSPRRAASSATRISAAARRTSGARL
jgi:hypothetical protein